jgi:hypothetical protein
MLVHATPVRTCLLYKTIEGTDYKRQTLHLGKLRFQNDSLLVRCKVAGNSFPSQLSCTAQGPALRRKATLEALDYLTP